MQDTGALEDHWALSASRPCGKAGLKTVAAAAAAATADKSPPLQPTRRAGDLLVH